MPILAGWGGKRKLVGNYGIHKCSNCHNWQPMGIYELSRQATLYFIPVAKWDKKYYIICPICEAGVPVSVEELAPLLQACITVPDAETAIQIWGEMQNFSSAFLSKSPSIIGAKEMEDWHKQITELMSHTKYRKEHINRVYLSFLQYFGEQLGAENS
jgi:hypothetical protein